MSAQTTQKDQGFVDLREYAFTTEEPARLTSQWEFYWNKLLAPGQFDSTQEPSWLQIREGWTQDDKYPGLGFATYRIHLILSKEQQGLSILFPAINSAGRIWVNGLLSGESGTVSENEETYKAKLTSLLVPLPGHIDTLEVVVQVSNFIQLNGGMWNYPSIDRTDDLLQEQNKSNGVENFFAGSLMAMGFYQLILYFLYRRGKPFLWLSLICFGVAVRAMIIHGGSFLLPGLYPDVSWAIWKKMEFGCVYSMVALFPLYIYYLFREYAPRRPLQIFVAVGLFYVGLVLITPQHIYARVLEFVHLSYLLNFAYAIYTIIIAWKNGHKDAKIILFGVLACFPFILLEIMKNSVFIGLQIPNMYYVEIGVLVFLLFQVYLLANHQAKSHKALESMNESLEEQVGQRTQELVTASTARDKLLSVISHDVRSPLNSLQGMLDLYNQGHITQEEFGQFSRQIQIDLSNTGLLVDNILLWTSSQLKGAKVQQERFNLHDLVVQNCQLFQTAATAKKLTISPQLAEKFEITWDKHIVHLSLRNLLANAIKFSHEGDTIHVTATREGNVC